MKQDLFNLIGLDRLCITVTEQQLQTYNDNCINEFNENEKGIQIEHSRLNKGLYEIRITAPMMFYQNNEKNVKCHLFKQLILNIQERLESYGIMLDVANANLGSFEINANINDIQLYYVLKLIAKANVNEHFKAFIVENINGIQSVKIKKSEYVTKVYKKSEHLQELFQSVEEEHLVRFEVSTNRATEKVKMLGDDMTLQSLFNNWDNVVYWYCNCIKNTIKKPINKYCKSVEEEVVSMLEQGIKPRQIIDDFMFREDLIDLLPIENGIRKHYKKIKKANANRDIKLIHNRLKKLNEKRYEKVTNNVKKLEELYALLGI